MDREEYIMAGLKRHLREFHKTYPNLELLFIGLQGSQNYDLDIYTDKYKSDIDTKAIIIPSLEDIVMNKKPISTTHVLPNNEHLDIKDIRLYFENFKKQNINFVEILFTPFNLVNKNYQDLWQKLLEKREAVAHYNKNQAIRCIAGMSMEKRKALCHPYPSLIEKIEKYGYDGKQLHHIIRMFDFITCYSLNGKYEECLKFLPHKSDMMKAKLQGFTLEEALDLAEKYDNLTKSIKDVYLDAHPKDEINLEAQEILYQTQYEVIKRKLQFDLEEKEDIGDEFCTN